MSFQESVPYELDLPEEQTQVAPFVQEKFNVDGHVNVEQQEKSSQLRAFVGMAIPSLFSGCWTSTGFPPPLRSLFLFLVDIGLERLKIPHLLSIGLLESLGSIIDIKRSEVRELRCRGSDAPHVFEASNH